MVLRTLCSTKCPDHPCRPTTHWDRRRCCLTFVLLNSLQPPVPNIYFFAQLLPHSVPPFKHVKAIIKNQHDVKRVHHHFVKSE